MKRRESVKWGVQAMIVCLVVLHACVDVYAKISSSGIVNKLVKVKPVGGNIGRNFLPLTEIPPPRTPHMHNGRRHLDEDCQTKPEPRLVYEGGKVAIFGDYYDERIAKTVATVIIPDHIDHKHFQVTTPIPYLTVGPIEALGHHPTTQKSEHPSECEKIYHDHLAEQYSDESQDYSGESLEMARMPVFPDGVPGEADQVEIDKMYSDLSV